MNFDMRYFNKKIPLNAELTADLTGCVFVVSSDRVGQLKKVKWCEV
jgi:hypothetical protein